MKKAAIFLFTLIIFGCSDENPATETVESIIHSSTTLNENSSLVPNSRNLLVYGAPVMFSRPSIVNLNIPPGSKIKKIKINQASYTVDIYDCSSEELLGVINPNLNISDDLKISLITLKEDFSSSLNLQSATSLEKDLVSQGYALIYFHTTIPQGNSTFDIRISIDLDVSIEYIRD